ncbi:MAG: hypothetical protein R2699_10530 [Acidimicrobiales bacterium]
MPEADPAEVASGEEAQAAASRSSARDAVHGQTPEATDAGEPAAAAGPDHRGSSTMTLVALMAAVAVADGELQLVGGLRHQGHDAVRAVRGSRRAP